MHVRRWSGSLVLGGLAVVGLVAMSCGGPAATSTPTPTTRAVATPTTVPTATPTPPTSKPTTPAVGTPTPTRVATTPTTTVAAATPTPTKAAVATPTPTKAPAPLTPTVAGKRGGVLREVQSSDVATFDSHRGGSLSQIWGNDKLYNNVVFNPGGDRIECDLCETYQYSADGKSITFKLRPNVKFHNGKVLDAEDIKYSILKMMGDIDGVPSVRTGVLKEYLDPSGPVTVVDNLTLKLNLARPSDFPLNVLAVGTGGIFPKDYPAESAARTPIGTGPYTVKGYVKGDHVSFERNPNYFKAGLPYLDGIEAPYCSNIQATCESIFLVGKGDLYLISSPFTLQNMPILERKVQSGEVHHEVVAYDGFMGVIFNLTKAPFNDLRVRKAVNLAIDRDGYLNTVYDGRGFYKIAVSAPLGYSAEEIAKMPGWRQPKDQDLAEAKKLMAEAGLGDGIDLELLSRTGSQYVATAEYFGAELRKIGIRTKVHLEENDVAYDLLAAYKYDLSTQRFAMTAAHPDEPIGGYFITGAARNQSGYSNPEMDSLFLKMSAETDPIKKKALVKQIEDILLRDIPFAFSFDLEVDWQWYSYVKGLEPGLSRYMTFQRYETAWIDK